jgi:hypothetical protein
MFEQFLPNKNKMLQYRTVYYSKSAVPKLGQLNTAFVLLETALGNANTTFLESLLGMSFILRF